MGRHLKPCAFILSTFPRTVKELQTRVFGSSQVTRYVRPSSPLVCQNRGSHKDSAYAQDSLSLSCKVADGPVSAALASRGSSDSGGMRRAQKGSENRSKPVSLPCLGVDTPNSVAQENSLFLLKMTQFTGQAEMKPTCRNKSVHYLKVPR